jgi:hypothetical protein
LKDTGLGKTDQKGDADDDPAIKGFTQRVPMFFPGNHAPFSRSRAKGKRILSWRQDPSRLLNAETIRFPETRFLTCVFRPITGRVPFPALNVTNDILLGSTNPDIHSPFSGNRSHFLHLHGEPPFTHRWINEKRFRMIVVGLLRIIPQIPHKLRTDL